MLASSALIASGLPALAQDATWLGADSDYNTVTNWSTGAEPFQAVATFDVFGTTSVIVGSSNASSWAFTAGGPYTIEANGPVRFSGVGINVTGGAGVSITNNATFQFFNSSTAGTADTAAIVNNGFIYFYDSATAGSSTITNNAGLVQFNADSTAGSATITNYSGNLQFNDNSTAGTATLVNDSNGSISFAGTTGALGDNKVTAGSIAGGGSFQLGANELTVGSNNTSTTVSGTIFGNGGSLVKTGSGTLILTGDNTYDAGTTISQGTLQIGDGGSTGSITGNVVNDGELWINRTGTLTLAGDISGSGSVGIGNSGGTVVLSGTNSYGGGTLINGGRVQVTNSSSVGTGTVSLAGGVFEAGADGLNFSNVFEIGLTSTVNVGSNTLTLTGGINDSGGGAGELIKTGFGTLVLSGTGDFSGQLTLTTGTLRFESSSAIGTANIMTGSATIDYVSGINIANAIELNGQNLKLQVTSGTATQSGAVAELAGANSVEKTGAGTLIVTDLNHAGTTRVTDGTLQAGTTNAFSATSAHVVETGGTLDLAGFSQTIASLAGGDGTVTSSSAGAVTLSVVNVCCNPVNTEFSGSIQDGAGTLALSLNSLSGSTFVLSGTNTYTGGTTITSGTLQIGTGGTSGSIVGDIVNNSALVINRDGLLTLDGVISGTGTLEKTGDGTLTLSGINTYDGGTFIEQGTVQVTNNGSVGTGGVTMNNETTFKAGAGGLSFGNAFVFEGNSTIDTSNFAMTLTGIISGSGKLIKNGSGTLILTNDNAYDDGTVIDEGTLQLGDGGTTGSITGNVVNNGVLAINRSNTYTLSGEIQGSGAFEQNGTGKTILTGTSFYDGTTTVNAGTLQVDGALTASTTTVNSGATLSGSGSVFDTTINSGGTLMPGDGSAPATLTVTGNLTFNGGSTYVVFMTPTVNSWDPLESTCRHASLSIL